MTSRETLFEHAGGEQALHRFVSIFYHSLLTDPLLVAVFGKGKPEHIDRLTAFECESFGGPDRFTREVGFQHLIDVHRHLHITEEQRQRFVDLYRDAMDKAGLPSDAAFRDALMEHVEFGSHVAMQNSNARTDDELHPLREVPHWNWERDPA